MRCAIHNQIRNTQACERVFGRLVWHLYVVQRAVGCCSGVRWCNSDGVDQCRFGTVVASSFFALLLHQASHTIIRGCAKRSLWAKTSMAPDAEDRYGR